jgi:mannose-6-phosphate isomerase-like protein (cupin superfamily)
MSTSPPFATKPLPAAPDVLAPDGSEVRVLLRLAGGSMAHFRLAPGEVSIAVEHRTVEELWYVVAGSGEMWRSQAGREEVTPLSPGVSLSIPLGTRFQFRCVGDAPFDAVGVTMPPWPGMEEAVHVPGRWAANLRQ